MQLTGLPLRLFIPSGVFNWLGLGGLVKYQGGIPHNSKFGMPTWRCGKGPALVFPVV